jgi:hypothetical protein
MSAKYIIRLDDASEYMDYQKWDPYFKLFDKYKIKPIIAVIPQNKDTKLINNTPNYLFWDLVRSWENKGYCIAMHGFDHVYLNTQSGLLKINPFSEFAGIPFNQQKEKLRKAQSIFEQNSIYPKVFVAPGHTFDINTIKALKVVTTVTIISDGFAIHGFKEFGIDWIPQQLWKPKRKHFGLWTICIHPETASLEFFLDLERFVSKNKESFESWQNVTYRKLKLYDYCFRIKVKYTIYLIKFLKFIIKLSNKFTLSKNNK